MGKLVCPICGSPTSFSPVMLRGNGISVKESSDQHTHRRLVMLEAVIDKEYFSYEDLYGKNFLYAILECQGCNEWFVAEKEKYADDWSAVYPILHKPVADEIPEVIKSEFEEAHLCFAVGAYRGCLLVCRTALIDMQREQKVSNLKELKDEGIITELLYRQADQVRLWANMVGHEVVLPEAIAKEDIEQLLTYLGILLDTVYVQPKRLSALSQKREQVKKETKPKPPLTKGIKPDSGLAM